MPVLKYRDPDDGTFKDFMGPTGPTGPAGPPGTSAGASDGALPIGAIMAYAGSVAPDGWHICDGSAHGSADLQAVIGSANTPDLRDKFVVASGPTYALGSTGGVAKVTLTADQSGMPSHTHTISVGSHGHDVKLPAAGSGGMSAGATHAHEANAALGDVFSLVNASEGKRDGGGGSDQNLHTYHPYVEASTTDYTHSHSLNIPAFDSQGASAGVTVSANTASSASTGHENMPPYYALVFIIKGA